MKHLIKILFFALLFYSCSKTTPKTPSITPKDTSLSAVIKAREIRAIINFNSTDYYIDRGTPVGFQLDLLNYYCTFMNIKLTPIVRENTKKEFFSLSQKEADIIVGDFHPTDLRKLKFNFTLPHSKSPLVLVQRIDSGRVKKINSGYHLIIHVPSHTSYAEYIDRWSAEKGITANIIFDNEHSSENLIEQVANGQIDYTVVESKIAKNNCRIFKNLDYSVQLTKDLYLCWVLPKESDSLRISINYWLEKFVKTPEYQNLYTRYYNTTYNPQILENRKIYSKSNKICKWDKSIKIASRKNKWDWKLYAALIYQESGFQPNLIGNGGCFGLLQLMPETGKRYGISPSSSPEVQISRGANYIKYLEKIYSKKVKDKEQLTKFVLASYNAGPGHVIDAINLAEKHGKDPAVWDKNVEVFLKLKSVPKYYNDPVVKSGYYRGAFTVRFVDDVWERYQHYRNFVR